MVTLFKTPPVEIFCNDMLRTAQMIINAYNDKEVRKVLVYLGDRKVALMNDVIVELGMPMTDVIRVLQIGTNAKLINCDESGDNPEYSVNYEKLYAIEQGLQLIND